MATITEIIEKVRRGESIPQPIILVTHESTPRFHADEVTATALLYILFNKYKIEKKLVKTFYPEKYGYTDDNPECIVYDIGLGMYDHHQPDGQNEHCLRIDKDGIVRKYSSVGLIWKEIGHYLVPEDYLDEVYNNLFKYIDDNDNGFEPNPLSYCIGKMNCFASTEHVQEQEYNFTIAVNMMANILNNIILNLKAKDKEKSVANQLIMNVNAEGKRYVISDHYMASMTNVCALNEIPFYLYPNARMKGNWCFRTITPIGKNMNEHFVDIPQEVRNWDGVTFLHPSGFLGSAISKERAIEVIETVLTMSDK